MLHFLDRAMVVVLHCILKFPYGVIRLVHTENSPKNDILPSDIMYFKVEWESFRKEH